MFRTNRIIHETSVPYTHEQNGVQERPNCTVIEKAWALLFDSGLPSKFWGEAVLTTVYLKSRNPTIALKNALPEELWSGTKVDVSN